MAPAFSTASAATAMYRPVTLAPFEPRIVGCRPGAAKPGKRLQARPPPAGADGGAPAVPARQRAAHRSRRAALCARGRGNAPERLVPRAHAAGPAVARETAALLLAGWGGVRAPRRDGDRGAPPVGTGSAAPRGQHDLLRRP